MKKINKISSKQNMGALMIEVLIVLALIIIITPMIYTRVSDYSQELEDGATAAKLKLLRQGIYTYMEANYERLTAGTMPIGSDTDGIGTLAGDSDVTEIDINDSELQRYIRPEYYSGSKLFDSVKVAIKRQKVGDTIVINSLISTTQDSGKTSEIDEKRGNRIAGLVGSEAGYVGGKADDKIARGAGGFFELDISEYFKSNASPNQIIISSGYYPAEIKVTPTASGGDFLFRKKFDSGAPSNYHADSHRMETDIDFGDYAGGSGGYDIEDVGKIYGKKYEGDISTLDPGAIDDFTYKNADGNAEEQAGFTTYGIDFETNTAFLDDMRIASLGGAKITEILPNLILMSVSEDISYGAYVPKPGFENPRVVKNNPGCPTGYSPRYELIQKEGLAGMDMLAVAEHTGDYASGINSVNSWLRNNKLLRSQYKNGATDIYYRIYGEDAEITGECKGSGSNIECVTFEYVNNEPKLSEHCTNTTTTVYDVNDADNVLDFNSASGLPYVNTSSINKWAEYDSGAGIVKIYAKPGGNPVVNIDGVTNTCKNKNYCPGFKDLDNINAPDAATQLMQHGNCQAALNNILSGTFLPYEGSWIQVDGDGTTGSTINNINLSTASHNVDPTGGIYYNTRLYHKVNNQIIESCPSGSATISGKNGLCENTTTERRYSILPVRHDLYYYCEKDVTP